jgi:Ca2+-binding EF-hand superfamily protein
MKCSILLLILPTVLHTASVDSNHGKDRVIHGEKMSNKEHDHDAGDYDYDHEAFLGVDEAREFDQLSPEESRTRLGKIVDRIDSNEDGFVSLDEMRDWIRFTQQRYISEDVDRQWNQHNVDNKENIGWQEYRQLVYGFLDEDTEDNHVDSDTLSYQYVIF